MKRIDRVLTFEILNTLLHKIYSLRSRYRLTDATLWDLIHTHLFQLQTGKGITVYQITQIRYEKQTTVRTIRDRRERLLKKGLIYVTDGRAYLSELGLMEMSLLGAFELSQIIKTIPSAAHSPNRRIAKKAA